MVLQNRGSLANLNRRRVEIRYNPDNPDAGVFAIDPRTKEPIVLHKVQAIDMFDADSFREELRLKKQQIAAATGAFRELTKGAQILIDSAKTRPFIEAEKLAAGLPSYAMPVAAGEDAPESSVNQTLAPSEKIADKISRDIKQYSPPNVTGTQTCLPNSIRVQESANRTRNSCLPTRKAWTMTTCFISQILLKI